jgi:hypothetical protein
MLPRELGKILNRDILEQTQVIIEMREWTSVHETVDGSNKNKCPAFVVDYLRLLITKADSSILGT